VRAATLSGWYTRAKLTDEVQAQHCGMVLGVFRNVFVTRVTGGGDFRWFAEEGMLCPLE
jgi:hypothetical protein